LDPARAELNDFDYEWASVQHNVNCRLASAVVVPRAIPLERLSRYGARRKLKTFEGLKEEYYLADFEPDPRVLDELRLDRARAIVVVRPPPVVSLYHRFDNDLFAVVLDRLRRAAADDGIQPVVLPRVDAQRDELGRLAGLVVPAGAIDAPSLIAHADLVISAGGTMNREAVALGTPVFTTFEGRMGAVDESLIASGRLHKLASADALDFRRREPHTTARRIRRDPQVLVDLLMSPLHTRAAVRR
jgi:predicted glycosyltransferase